MKNIENHEEYLKIINSDNSFLYYSADWCQPCKVVKPILKLLESSFPEISFYNIDVEKVNVNVKSIPTFHIMVNNNYSAMIGVHTFESFSEEIIRMKNGK